MGNSLEDLSSSISLKTMYDITGFILSAIKRLDAKMISKMVDMLVDFYQNKQGRILVMGAGRSGLVGRAFAMRLLHLGYNAYVLGETIVPAIREGDIVIAISGSGKTKLIVTAAEAAKEAKARLIAVTSYPDSPLGRLADLVIEVPGRTKYSNETD
ncbi:MAG: SIS domain-containing protein, partial [Sulfolobales archaeon]|nr:SIS domain-containing protein [Sulfolobales archaeon]